MGSALKQYIVVRQKFAACYVLSKLTIYRKNDTLLIVEFLNNDTTHVAF